jgi:hypothetical protein
VTTPAPDGTPAAPDPESAAAGHCKHLRDQLDRILHARLAWYTFNKFAWLYIDQWNCRGPRTHYDALKVSEDRLACRRISDCQTWKFCVIAQREGAGTRSKRSR